jgi:hypothetical protein
VDTPETARPKLRPLNSRWAIMLASREPE